MEDKEIQKLQIDDTHYETNYTTKFVNRKRYVKPDPNKITAFIPGIITKVYVKDGSRVKRGDKLLVLEAMKMKNDVTSPRDGAIKNIFVEESKMVAKGETLIEFEI
jgi:biotin carboxyl carrier protein